jgi:hypothetical protein
MSWFIIIWSGAVIVLGIAAVFAVLGKTTTTQAKTKLLQEADVVGLFIAAALGSLLLLLDEVDLWNVPGWLYVMWAFASALLFEIAERRKPEEERSRWARFVPWAFVVYLVLIIVL